MTTAFNMADKVAALKAKLQLVGWRVNRCILDMPQTLAGIMGDTEPRRLLSQLENDHMTLFLKESEPYFPTTRDPQAGKNGSATHFTTNQVNLVCQCKQKTN